MKNTPNVATKNDANINSTASKLVEAVVINGDFGTDFEKFKEALLILKPRYTRINSAFNNKAEFLHLLKMFMEAHGEKRHVTFYARHFCIFPRILLLEFCVHNLIPFSTLKRKKVESAKMAQIKSMIREGILSDIEIGHFVGMKRQYIYNTRKKYF